MILPLNSEAIGTNLPVLLFEKLQDRLTVEITETDLVGLGAQGWPDAVLTAISTLGPGAGPLLVHLFITELFQSLRGLCFVLFK